MKVSRQIRWAVFAVLIAFTAGAFVFNADAQTKRKKTTKKTAAAKPTPKPLATPLTLSDAEIISRAADQETTMQPTVMTPAKTTADPVQTDKSDPRIKALSNRVKKLETPKTDPDEKQKRVLLNLDILTRSEQRADSLRKSLFDMIEKENAIKSRLDQIENEIRPEMIERTLQLSGSMRPEEIRDIRRKSLAAERTNLQSLLTDIQTTRANLAVNVQKADELVEKLRSKMEKDIDDSLKDTPEN